MDKGRRGQLEGHKVYKVVSFLQLICTSLWIGGILYSTYQLILTTQEYLPFYGRLDPVMNNAGSFTRLIGRGKDSTDWEWVNFTLLYFPQLIYWLVGYLVLGTLLRPARALPQISLILSFILLVSVLNLKAAIYLFIQPVFYWWLLQWVKSKWIIWLISFTLLNSLNWYDAKEVCLGLDHSAEHHFDICLGWMYARCISFTFDRWNRNDNSRISALCQVLCYCFYFPLLVKGPLILYNRYEADILQGGCEKNPDRGNVVALIKRATKVIAYSILAEVIIHFIYFRRLSLALGLLNEINLWSICGVIFWLGQFFMLKYHVFYGSSSCIAQFDGVEMPPLPKCISHIHRYSVLWKDFDRGLYNFLVRYTYVPTLEAMNSNEKLKSMPVEVKKLTASLFAFSYVFVWHRVAYPVFVWSFFNFIGISIEGAGSSMKKWLERRINWNELFWDIVVEPIVTIPLAAMSILNSIIFTGSPEAAVIFTQRLLWAEVNVAVVLFLLCFTQVGVATRTWSKCRIMMRSALDWAATSGPAVTGREN